MLTQEQNILIYLMFLNGILFLGLNFIAYSIVNPGPKGSKRIGYVLIVSAFLAFLVQQEYQTLVYLDFPTHQTWQVLIGGFISPVFILSLVCFRIQKRRDKKSSRINKTLSSNES